jgi:2,3,4,5-tetrahydropyridine-2,6-dicarboxylate N-succinyltransferase
VSVPTIAELEEAIENLANCRTIPRTPDSLHLIGIFRQALRDGSIRAARPRPAGGWEVCGWVKKGILLAAQVGRMTQGTGSSFDLDTLPPRTFSGQDGVRIPGAASWVRDGAYLAPGVICLPPAVINIGAYVGAGSVVDSHSMVGSCTQIGASVQIGPGTQIAGLITPVDHLPVIIEDRVLIVGNCGIYGSVVIGEDAVLGPGVMLSNPGPIYDIKRNQIHRAAEGEPLAVPAGAVVVPAARQITNSSPLSQQMTLQVPVIIGYRYESDSTNLLDRWLAGNAN